MKNITSLSIIVLSFSIAAISCEKKEVIVNTPSTNTTVVGDSVTSTTPAANAAATPAIVTSFVSKHFPNIPIVKTEIKSSPLDGKSYEVKLNDGAEIELNEQGDWTEIKDPKGVPSDIVPSAVATYLKSNYNGIVAEKIEKEKNGYKIDLITGVDLKFDSNGKFLKIDK